MAKKNYYKILGVSQTATPEELSAAKNLLAKQYHPDVNMKKGIDTTKQMQLILEAYRVLSDPDKRAAYDTKLFGKKSAKKKRSFNIYNMEETPFPEEVSFVTYWRVADSLTRSLRKATGSSKNAHMPTAFRSWRIRRFIIPLC